MSRTTRAGHGDGGARGGAAGFARAGAGASILVGKAGSDDLLVRGARVVDPAGGVDATLDVRVDGGTIVELGTALDANGHRVIDGAGLLLAPAFVDPHVHLRTPGREDEETIASGTAAAAAGGYCAILAMPNTDPVVDSTDLLRGLRTRAAEEAEVPVGFTAAISVGQQGTQLTEMGELADAGAAAFTDDGRPVASAGLMRRALEYNAITGRPLALHCEEPTLTRGGHMHMGTVSAELGLGGWPSLGESLGVARELALGADTGQPLHLMHLSARESIELLRRSQAAGVRASGEVTPHHLCLTDEAVRNLDANLKMNPPLRSSEDRAALIEALNDSTIAAVATDHAPHSREEKEAPFEAAPFGVTGLETAFAALYTHLVEPGLVRLETLLERMSAGPARIFGLERPRIAVGAPANFVLLDTQASWKVRDDRFRSRSANSWLLGARLRGKVRLTVAAGRIAHES
jgi:dihydroorotase